MLPYIGQLVFKKPKVEIVVMWFVISDGMTCGKLAQSTVHIRLYIISVCSQDKFLKSIVKMRSMFIYFDLFIKLNVKCFKLLFYDYFLCLFDLKTLCLM